MPPLGFGPTISAGERLQTDALDRAATGTGVIFDMEVKNNDKYWVVGPLTGEPERQGF